MTSDSRAGRIRKVRDQVDSLKASIEPRSRTEVWESIRTQENPTPADVLVVVGGQESVDSYKAILAVRAEMHKGLWKDGLDLKVGNSMPMDLASRIAAVPLNETPDQELITGLQRWVRYRRYPPRPQDSLFFQMSYSHTWGALAVTTALGAPDGAPLRAEIAAGLHADAAQQIPDPLRAAFIYDDWEQDAWRRRCCWRISGTWKEP